MTKIIPFFILLLIPSLSFSQTDSLITFTEIVATEGVSKDILFQNARQWYNKTFISSKEVLQVIDKESGELSGKGILESSLVTKVFGVDKTYPCYYRFSLDIKVKDGKYKYTFSNFIVDKTLTNISISFPPMTSSSKCPVKFPGLSQEKTDLMYLSMQINLKKQVEIFINELKKQMNVKSNNDF